MPTPGPVDGVTGDCTAGASQSCDCGQGSGTQECVAGAWEACVCDSPEPTPNPPPTGKAKCKPGYYTGWLKGKWRPGAFDLGGGATLVKASIETQDTAAGPGLAITLEEQSEGGGEFMTYTVSNGCATGMAESSGTENPFVARVTGSLDCETGEFKGNMEGQYDLLSLGSPWYFTGDTGAGADPVPFYAKFDPDAEKLTEGTFDLREKQAKLDEDPGAGGEGTWEVTWQAFESPPLPEACKALAEPQP